MHANRRLFVPGFVRGILQARILEWVAIFFSITALLMGMFSKKKVLEHINEIKTQTEL